MSNDSNVSLKVLLDSSGIGSKDIAKIQKILEKYQVNVAAQLNQKQLMDSVKKILPQVIKEINKQSNQSITIDIDDRLIEQSIHQVISDSQRLEKELSDSAQRIKKETEQGVFHKIASSLHSLGASFNSSSLLQKLLSGVKSGIHNVRQLDAVFTELKQTTTMTSDELERFYYSSNDMARHMGVTTKSILEQAAAWSRLGYSNGEQAAQLAQYSSMLAAISPGMSLEDSTAGLSSVMEAFQIGVKDADEVVDGILSKISSVGSSKSLNNSDLFQLLRLSSGAMAKTNNTLEDTIALGAALIEITQDAAGAGQVLNAITRSMQGFGADPDGAKGLADQLASLTKTAQTPEGIRLFSDSANTTMKSTRQLLEEISEIYDQLGSQNQADLLAILAGEGDTQAVAGILNNFRAVTDALNTMAHSAGSAEAEMAIVMDSVDYKVNAFQETAAGIAQNLFQREDIKVVLDGANSLLGIFDALTEKLGLFGSVGLGAGLFSSLKNVGMAKS